MAVTTTSGYVTVLDWCNVALAAVACAVHLLAGRRGLIAVRWVRYSIAFLAATYTALYLWLILGDITVAEWSNLVRGIGPVAWVVVWILPAVLGLRVARKVDRHIKGDT